MRRDLALVTLLVLVLSTGTSKENETEYLSARCFCCSQNCHFDAGRLTCASVSKFGAAFLRNCSAVISSLAITGGLFKTMHESGLLANETELPALENFTLRNSSIEKLADLPNKKRLDRIVVTDNANLKWVDWRVFDDTRRLSHLNLSHNRLYFVEERESWRNLSALDLSGNEWPCESDFGWLVELHRSGVLANGDGLTCLDEIRQRGSWISWRYSILKREENKRIVQAECEQRTASCSCQFRSEGREGRGSYTVQVDCSRRNLTVLPPRLPNNTDELDVSGNQLTSLDLVNEYKTQPLRILIADSNRIQSIRNLSRSAFIRNFSRFSLQHNFISPYEIPLDELTEVSSGFQVKYVYLFNNSWECDCKMSRTIRDWLLMNRNVVNDSSLLMCSRHGKKIPVLHLLPETICTSWADESEEAHEQHTIKVLQALIGLEIALILLVAVKLAYDSWRYIKHGELPWIATKLL